MSPGIRTGTTEAIYLDERQFEATMELIVAALKERGYDPYAQLYGYIKENEPTYITSHNNARSLIKTLDIERVRRYVMEKRGTV
jgi:uncharacterized protein (UPF0297 family)